MLIGRDAIFTFCVCDVVKKTHTENKEKKVGINIFFFFDIIKTNS